MDIINALNKSAKKDARVKKLLEILQDELTADKYIQHIDEITKLFSMFHHYSILNYVLMILQYPDVELVAGMRKWNSLGRKVKKGEHAIKIFAPIKSNVRASIFAVQYLDNEGNVNVDNDLTVKVYSNMNVRKREAMLNNLIAKGKEKYANLYYGITEIDTYNFYKVDAFTVVNVFDIKQTEVCKKYEKCYSKKPFTIEDAVTYKYSFVEIDDDDFLQKMINIANSFVNGVYIEKFNAWKLNARKGYYLPEDKTIHINSEISSFDKATTIIHELSHALLDMKYNIRKIASYEEMRSLEEVIVETTAYIVTKLIKGIEYEPSKEYIAFWLHQNNATPKILLNLTNIVSALVNDIYDAYLKIQS